MANKADQDLKEALSALPKDRLVTFITGLVDSHPALGPPVEMLLASNDVSRAEGLVRDQIAAIRAGRHFMGRGRAREFAGRLHETLEAIEQWILPVNPQSALDLVARFITRDHHAFEMADDSDGAVGDLFRRACALFAASASRCPSAKVMPVLRRLLKQNDYGARDTLLDGVAGYLDHDHIARLINELREEMRARGGESWSNQPRLWLMAAADSLGDPELYEAACLQGSARKAPVLRLHVAQRYLRAGRADEAEARMPENAESCGGYAHEWFETRVNLFRALGRESELRQALWSMFVLSPSRSVFDALLAAAPEADHQALLEKARAEIMRDHRTPAEQATFFVALGDLGRASGAILTRPKDLNGDLYYQLLSLGEALEADHPEAATAVFRALLESILDRAQTKTYRHGARYWHRLDDLARRVADWTSLEPHESYRTSMEARHARKSSFWRAVQGQRAGGTA